MVLKSVLFTLSGIKKTYWKDENEIMGNHGINENKGNGKNDEIDENDRMEKL